MVGGAVGTFISLSDQAEVLGLRRPDAARPRAASPSSSAATLVVARAQRPSHRHQGRLEDGADRRWPGRSATSSSARRSIRRPTTSSSTPGWVGGLGLPVVLGWAFGGAGGRRHRLHHRPDLPRAADATISPSPRSAFRKSSAQLIKNMEWLTRGTLTVSPIRGRCRCRRTTRRWASIRRPRCSMRAAAISLLIAGDRRGGDVPADARLWRAVGPHDAGDPRQLHRRRFDGQRTSRRGSSKLFVLGSVLMGMGGAILVSFAQIFDPRQLPADQPHLPDLGDDHRRRRRQQLGRAVRGGVHLHRLAGERAAGASCCSARISDWSTHIGWGAIPDIESRSLQMRVFVLGLVISIALRYAPRGLIPETSQTSR